MWSKRLGTSSTESGVTAMADSGDSILLVGKFSGSTNVGGSNFTSAGGTDLFLAEYTQSGTHVWSRGIGGSGGETAQGMAVDPAGNAIVVGSFSGTTDLGDGPAQSAGGLDIFVAKYSGSGGAPLWSRRFGSTTDDTGNAVATDFRGDVFVTGSFTGTVDFGGISLTSTASDTFIAKLSGDTGATLWARNSVNNAMDVGHGVAVDGNGDLYVTGYFMGLIDFGGGAQSSAGGEDIYLLHLDGAFGDLLWSRRFGGTGTDIGYGVGVDAQDNVALMAIYRLSADFGGGGLTSSGITDIALAKYSPTGVHLWSRTVGGTALETPTGLWVDPAGDVLLAGYFQTSTNLGGGTYTSAGGFDAFAAKYTAGSGAHLWSRSFGGASTDFASGIVTDGNGYVMMAGAFWGTTDFGDSLRTSAGSSDAFLLRLAP
jgi:hypothetical protein